MSKLRRTLVTNAPVATIFIRLAVGCVFLSEGIQKFLYPAELGIGRFAKLGLPSPEILAPFIGAIEIICGSLIVLGLLTRLAAIPLIIDMIVAIYTTKIAMLTTNGFWSMAHEARVDFTMLLGALFLLTVGAGRISVDANLRS